MSKPPASLVPSFRRTRRAALVGFGALIIGCVWIGSRFNPPERAVDLKPAGSVKIGGPPRQAALPNPPARPFIFRASASDRGRAETCLAQAIYFEAGDQSDQGQAAVAQTVLNRVRHPYFPKSICGVVYQGANLTTGCQYSFACNQALRREPNAGGWSRALAVARRALGGYVEPGVGWATHYHADYVAPYWEPRLIRLTQIGAHIFYRWPGSAGEPSAFSGRYGGHEDYLPPAVLTAGDPPALQSTPSQADQPRTVSLNLGAKSETYTINDPGRGGVVRQPGTLTPSRPHPTSAQVAEINALLSGSLEDKAAAGRVP